jgi:hypothetical protein
MRKKIEFAWEVLDETTHRAKVIGGWIVRSQWGQPKTGLALTSVFISDRDHEWCLPKLIDEQKPQPSKLVAAEFTAAP